MHSCQTASRVHLLTATSLEIRQPHHGDLLHRTEQGIEGHALTMTMSRVALFNIGYPVFKPFLQTTDEDVQKSLEGNVSSAFAFSREVVLRMRENTESQSQSDSSSITSSRGKGTLIFTGATASQRGNVMTSAFAAAKAGNRMLSQSLAKEFGREGIHVVHVSSISLKITSLLRLRDLLFVLHAVMILSNVIACVVCRLLLTEVSPTYTTISEC